MENYDFIRQGKKVYWNDPEGLTSGIYEISGFPEDIDEGSIILITDGYSEAEVYPCELTPVEI